jgi:hypothetical protein
MATGHAKIYNLIHKNLSKKPRRKGDKTVEKIMQSITQCVTPLFKEFESGEYELKLGRFVSSSDEQRISKALSLFVDPSFSPSLSYASEPPPSQKVELVSLMGGPSHPEQNLGAPLWRVIEQKFGGNPWGPLHEELMQKTTWPLVVNDMEKAMRKKFSRNPLLAALIADNMRDALYYFLAFAARERIGDFVRLRPVVEIVNDLGVLGINPPPNTDTWRILTG